MVSEAGRREESEAGNREKGEWTQAAVFSL